MNDTSNFLTGAKPQATALPTFGATPQSNPAFSFGGAPTTNMSAEAPQTTGRHTNIIIILSYLK